MSIVQSPVARAVSAIVRGVSNGEKGGGQAGSTLAFHALTYDDTTYEMLGVKTGTGDLTTDHTSDLYAKDHEDVYRLFGEDEPVWSGGRVVGNHMPESDDWTVNGSAQADTVIQSATELYYPGTSSNQRVYQEVDTGREIPEDMSRTDIPLTTSWRRYFFGHTFSNGLEAGISFEAKSDDLAGSGETHVKLDRVSTTTRIEFHVDNSIEGTLEIRNLQVEFGPGTSSKPGEFVATSGGSTGHAGVPVAYKVYANENGNSVASNVVTEAVGSALSEAPYLQYYPAATNAFTYSNDASGTGWTAPSGGTKTFDQVGLTGEPNTATLIEDTDGASTYPPYHSDLSFSGSVITCRIWVKKDNDESRFPNFRINWFGGSAVSEYLTFNTKTGASHIATATSNGTVTHEVIDEGDWWAILSQYEQTSEGNTSVRYQIRPAYTTTLTGSEEVSATGSIVMGNLEAFEDKTIAEVRGLGPIFSEGSSVTTDATVYYFGVSNASDDPQAWFFETFSTVDEAVLAGNSPLASPTENRWIKDYSAQTRFFVDGDTLVVNEGAEEDAAREIGFVYDFGSTQAGASVNGSAWDESSSAAGWADTGLSNTGIYIGCEDEAASVNDMHPAAVKFRNFRIYDIPDYAAGKSTIDDLMS